MIKAVTSQQHQDFKSKRQRRAKLSTDAESFERLRSQSRSAYIQELRRDWEDTS